MAIKAAARLGIMLLSPVFCLGWGMAAAIALSGVLSQKPAHFGACQEYRRPAVPPCVCS